MMDLLKKLSNTVLDTQAQQKFERKAKMWKNMMRDKKFNVLLEHIEDEINFLHRILEDGDDVDARAEIKVYKKLLQMSEVYGNNESKS